MTTPSSVLALGGRALTTVTGGFPINVPISTLPVVSTVGFPTVGQIAVETLVGGLYTTQQIDYDGIVDGAFLNCTGWTAGQTGGGASVQLQSSQQFSYVTRSGVTLPTYVGPNFALLTLTSATGTAQVGDVLQEATSLATATVAQVIQAGSTTIVFVNGVTRAFSLALSVTTISGSGNLAGT